jgi:pimeloyl-ACP methyl ester carboxylesterase
VIEAKTPEAAKTTVRELLAQANVPAPAAAAQTEQVTSAWYAAFIAYDPRRALAKLPIPLLALNGDKDVQVVSSLNLPAIRTATRADRNVKIVELPGLNHLFQTSATGDPRDHGKIEETFSPTALKIISEWILSQGRSSFASERR